MKIIKIKKIKLILILIITILILLVFISLLPHSCKQDSEIEHVPVLSLAPDGIISPKITFKNIRKTGTSYAIDSEGNVIIQDENGDRYVRISLCAPPEKLREAAGRIAAASTK